MESRMSSKFGQIRPLTAELAALERLEKSPLLAFMLVLLVDCHINHVSKTIVSRTKSLSNIHRITIHVCQGEELNKLCFRSDPFLHSPIYPYVLKCYMYFLE